MKKIINLFLLLTLVFLLCCCNSEMNISSDTSTQIVVLPDVNTAINVNGYKAVSSLVPSSSNEETSNIDSSVVSSSSQEISIYYVGNKKSKKVHTQFCKYVKSISDKNLHSFDSLEDANEQGYSHCSYCLKQ